MKIGCYIINHYNEYFKHFKVVYKILYFKYRRTAVYFYHLVKALSEGGIV